jgi:hypothetical protein
MVGRVGALAGKAGLEGHMSHARAYAHEGRIWKERE